MKTCTKCKVEYPGTLEYFHKHTLTKDKLRPACKTCTNKANAEYQKANPEKVKAKNDAWVKANYERHRANQNAWAKANPEKKKAWSKANPEQHKALIEKWRKENPDKRRQHQRKQRAKKSGVIHESWTEKELISLYGADCYLCNTPIDFDAPRKGAGSEYSLWPDHVIPLSKGGSDILGNVRPCHSKCNRFKHDKDYEEYMLTANSQDNVTQSLQ